MEDRWEGDGVKVWEHTAPKDKGTAEPRPGPGERRTVLRAGKAQ